MKFLIVLAALATVAFAEFHLFVEDREIDNEITRKIDFRQVVLRKGEEVRDVITRGPKNIVEDKIIAFLEELREQFPVGFPDSGIPPLDPFTLEKATLTLNQPLIFRADINIENVMMTGLKDFIIETVRFNILRLSFDFDLDIPDITYDSDFNVNGRMVVIYPFDFGGVARMRLEHFKIGGSTNLGTTSDGYLTLRSLKLTLDVDKISLNLTGIEGDGPLNDILNWLQERIDEDLIHGIFASISDQLSEALFDSFNDILGEISLADLIG